MTERKSDIKPEKFEIFGKVDGGLKKLLDINRSERKQK